MNLDLRYNTLSGTFPALRLPLLQRVAVSNNRISSLPEDFTGLTSLTFMDLARNELTGAVPPSLGGVSPLQDLYLNSNRLEGQIPGEFASLTRLVRLDLSANGFEGAVPDFQRLKNLRFLSVSDNHLSGEVPSSLASLPVLFTLNLDGNDLSGVLPFPPTFVHKMGRNLAVKRNAGLCYTEQLDGLNPCPRVVMVAKSPTPSPPNGSSQNLPVFGMFFTCWLVLLLLLV